MNTNTLYVDRTVIVQYLSNITSSKKMSCLLIPQVNGDALRASFFISENKSCKNLEYEKQILEANPVGKTNLLSKNVYFSSCQLSKTLKSAIQNSTKTYILLVPTPKQQNDEHGQPFGPFYLNWEIQEDDALPSAEEEISLSAISLGLADPCPPYPIDLD